LRRLHQEGKTATRLVTSQLYTTGEFAKGMDMNTFDNALHGLTPNHFLSEVRDFRDTMADPTLSADAKRRAYGVIINHAAALNPHDVGFENAGVALKEALCMWLDYQPEERH
jgi:hypothetical protein